MRKRLQPRRHPYPSFRSGRSRDHSHTSRYRHRQIFIGRAGILMRRSDYFKASLTLAPPSCQEAQITTPTGTNDTKAEMVVSDGLEDWFPHISPDGMKMVYIGCPAGTPNHNPRTVQIM